MKYVFLFLFVLLACDHPETPTITGKWQGTMYLCKRPYNITFDLCQNGSEISGYFLSGCGSGLVEISDSSEIHGNRVTIVAVDSTYHSKYVFSGDLVEDCIKGKYTLILYGTPGEDCFVIYKSK